MNKKLVFIEFSIFAIFMIILVWFLSTNNYECLSSQYPQSQPIPAEELVEDEVVLITNRHPGGDDYLLAKIAMAEAEGESIEGKALVMLVVLNRVNDSCFPDTVGEVIFQHKEDIYQFSPMQEGGRFYTNEPNEDCWEALELVKSGWDESQGALYFESCEGNTWHNRNLELLFEEGGHQFYK